MPDVLYQDVAEFYEGLYRKNLAEGKGIVRECDVIEQILLRNGLIVKNIIDMGCGTGIHAIELAGRGYEVLAADFAQPMLDIARKRAGKKSARLSFRQADMRQYVSEKKFDALICMTNAFLCNYTAAHVRQALSCFAKSLRPGGVLLIEASSYLAMMEKNDFAFTYMDSAKAGGREVVEVSVNEPDLKNHVLKERNTYFISNADGTYSRHSSENKLLLLALPQLEKNLAQAGFRTRELIDANTLRPAKDGCTEYFIVAQRV